MKLVMVSGPEQGKTFDLAPGKNFIGRAEENSVVLPSGQVSRRHACVAVMEGRYYLEDLGSANGTFLGGQRLQGVVEIRPGMPFQLGEFTLELNDGSNPLGARAGVAPAPVAPPRSTMMAQQPVKGRPAPVAAPVVPVGFAPTAAHSESSFWKIYRTVAFLGWRGQVALLVVATMAILTGVGVYPLLVAEQQVMTAETLKRGEILVTKLAMRNGEFIKSRQETNLDTTSFLTEQGVAEAYVLSKDLNVLSPVEQRGKPKANRVAREALIKGDVVRYEGPEVEGSSDGRGVWHIAAPIKVWSAERTIYEPFGVAYIVFRAREVAEADAGTNTKFIGASLVIVVTLIVFAFCLFMITNRPLKALQEDAELVLRGDLRTVEARARWKELLELSHSLNRSFDRYHQALNTAAAAAPVNQEVGPSFLGQPATAASVSEDLRVEAIASAVSEGVILTDDMQRVVYLNRVAEKLFGVTLARARTRHVIEVITNQDVLGAVLELFKQLQATDERTVSMSVPIADGSGGRKVGLVVSGVKNASRQLEYAAIVIR